MKALFILFMVVATGLSAGASPRSEILKQALESASDCSNFVRFDDKNIYLGFGPYRHFLEEPRSPIPSMVQVIPIANPNQTYNLSIADSSIDSFTDGDTLFVLTYSGIEEWDLSARTRKAIYATSNAASPLAYMQHTRAFARYHDKLILAHGRMGVSFFDLKEKRLTGELPLLQKQLPMESMATSVTVNGKYAYVLMDNYTMVTMGPPAFRGIVVIDMEQEKVVAEIPGLDPGADAIVNDGQKLIVSYMGQPIWKYSLDNLLSLSTLSKPEQKVWHFPVDGHPLGSPALDDKYYYTCFTKASANGFYTPATMVLDRHSLNL